VLSVWKGDTIMTTETATIVDISDERLIRDGEAAVDHYLNDLKNTRSRIMPMALGLLVARRAHKADREFGAWLQASPYNKLGKTDRAALINIGKHADFAVKFIRTTILISPETIWSAIEGLLPPVSDDRKPENQAPVEAKGGATASTKPVAAPSANSTVAESGERPRHDVVGSGSSAISDPGKAALPKQLGIDHKDYAEFLSAYPKNPQRAIKSALSALADKRGGKKHAVALFELGLEIVRAGKAVQISGANTGSKEPDARVFLPHVPPGITKYITMKQLVERIDRLRTVDKAAEGGAHFDDIAHLWNTGTERPAPVKPVIVVPPEDTKARIKHEVKFCGEVIWPSEHLRDVSFNDMNTGWHLMHYWYNYLGTASPQKPNEIMVQIGHLMHDIKAADTIEGLYKAMSACATAFSRRHPRGTETVDLSGSMPPGLAR
jgi:hypothetical protein